MFPVASGTTVASTGPATAFQCRTTGAAGPLATALKDEPVTVIDWPG